MADLGLTPFLDSFPLMVPDLVEGVKDTLKLTYASLAVGIVVGFLLALAKMSRRRGLARLASLYIDVVRGTPALVQLFLIYFGLVSVGIRLGAFEAAVIGLGLNCAAYLAEVFRAGLLGVDRGQREAAQAIGMTPAQAMRYIIAPQATRIILPPFGNSAIALLKDTSIAALISAPDLLLRGRNLVSEYFLPLPILLTVGAIYFLLCFPLSTLVHYFERRWRRI